MKDDLSTVIRANPDIAALALLVVLLVPPIGVQPNPLRLIFASRPSAESVWQRLDYKMRRFEQRFDRAVPPRVRTARAHALASE